MTYRKVKPFPEDQYYRAAHPKDLIVLHHTVGLSAESSIAGWRRDPRRVATAFVIERDGTVLEVFPPEFWAYHLGLAGTRGAVDRRSIGIELASEGGLVAAPDGYFFVPDARRPQRRFRVSGAVYDHGRAWRGQFRYFAAYPAAQTAAAVALVDRLLERFGIPRQTPGEHDAADFGRWKDYAGVLSHSHLRPDKTDVHPGFPWAQLVESCKLRLT